MKNPFLIFCIFILSTLFNNPITAQSPCVYQTDSNGNSQWINGQTGEPCPFPILTAVPYLRINPDARSAGMGDVGIATSGDANAILFNFSKISFSDQQFGISTNYTPYPKRTTILSTVNSHDISINGFFKLDPKSTVGVGLRMYNSSIILNDSPPQIGNLPENRKASDAYLNLSFARKLSNHFSASLGLKYIYSNLDIAESPIIDAGNSYALDIGFNYQNDFSLFKKNSNLSVGLAIKDAGTKMKYGLGFGQFLPTKLGIGSALKTYLNDKHSITFAADANKLLVPTPSDFTFTEDTGAFEGMFQSFVDSPGGLNEELSEIAYSFGAEYMFKEKLAVRAGYFSEDPFKGDRKYFTLGTGFTHKIFTWNISYSHATNSTNAFNLNKTMRFSMLVNLEKLKKKE